MGYTFDSDQLPELPDPGPRDGRHGVDRDDEYDPFPALCESEGEPAELHVRVEDAKRHLAELLRRVESGQSIVLTSGGRAVARLVSPDLGAELIVSETIVTTVSVGEALATNRRLSTRRASSTDDGDQLPALPDPGPRDGRHGVDNDRGYPFGG